MIYEKALTECHTQSKDPLGSGSHIGIYSVTHGQEEGKCFGCGCLFWGYTNRAGGYSQLSAHSDAQGTMLY